MNIALMLLVASSFILRRSATRQELTGDSAPLDYSRLRGRIGRYVRVEVTTEGTGITRALRSGASDDTLRGDAVVTRLCRLRVGSGRGP